MTTRLNRTGAVPLPLISSNPIKFMLVAELVVVGTDILRVFCLNVNEKFVPYKIN